MKQAKVLSCSLLLLLPAALGLAACSTTSKGSHSEAIRQQGNIRAARTLSDSVGVLVTAVTYMDSSLMSISDPINRAYHDDSIAGSAWSYSPYIELASADLQKIGQGFDVARLKMETAPGGIRISGRLINTQAVSYEMAAFNFIAGLASEGFTVPSLPAGGSADFSVLLQGINPDSVRYGQIRYLRATMNYNPPRD